MNYFLHLTVYFGIYAMLAMSLNVIVGYCGYLTLAHAGYYALGGYVYAIATLHWGLSFPAALVLAVLIAGVLSLAISLPAWHFSGDYYVMITLAVQVLMFTAFHNWYTPNAEIGTISNLTNGPFGISGVPGPSLFGFEFSTTGEMAALSLTLAIFSGLVLYMLLDSPWGRLLKGIRDDELVTRGLGKNVRLVKVQAMAISCMIAAVAGVVYAGYVTFIDPSSASLDESILMLAMVIVGGVGNFRGPIIGALILLLIPEGLRFLEIPSSIAPNIRLLSYGLALVLMMHFRPQGIAGEYRLDQES